MKKFLKLSSVLALTLVLVACGKSSDKKEKTIDLSMMTHVTEALDVEWEDGIIEEFEKAHPNVNIEIQRMGYDDYIQTIQTKFASGDAPDIFQMENMYLEKYVDNGYVTDLTDTEAASHYDTEQLTMMTLKDKIYGFPIKTNVLGVTYNKDIFEKAGIKELPKTESEFYDVAKKIQDAGYIAIAGAYQETWAIMAELQADYINGVLLKNNTEIEDLVSRKTTFENNAEWEAIFERLQKRRPFMQDDIFGANWDAACTLVANGEAGMVINGEWAANNIKELNEDVNIGMFPLPITENPDDAKFVVHSPREGLAVSEASTDEEKEAAKEFLAFYTSAESATKFVNKVNSICVIKGAEVPETSSVYDVVKAMENGETETLTVNHNFPNEERNAVETLTGEFMLEKDNSIPETLKKLDKEFDRIAQ